MRADLVYLDLGMSSMQVDTRERGFSYAYDAPLDMRMDPGQALTAAELLNTWDQRRIARVLRDYGEERFADRIAREIVRRAAARARRSSSSTRSPRPSRRRRASPAATRPSARSRRIRIAVNDELAQLDAALPLAWRLLGPGGRLAAISFHSLEDRRVKRFLADRARRAASARRTCRSAAVAARRRPSWCSAAPSCPRPGEVADNPRSKSARLRAARKLHDEVPV